METDNEVADLTSRSTAISDVEELQGELDALFIALDQVCLASIYSKPTSPRVQYGELLLRHSLICQLLTQGFHLRSDHPRVTQSASAIIELLIEMYISTGQMANMLHPLMMGGCLAPKEERDKVLTIAAAIR
jgi:hypothetical protein